MLTYNTQLKDLALPEYGRNIQRMVDHCLTIQNKTLRTECAHTIIDTMYKLFPPNGDQEEYRKKLWDHLAIMSDFQLDIDWPVEVIRPDTLNTQPNPVPLPIERINNRQYGICIEHMVEQISMMEPSEDRDVLIRLVANHMKKLLLSTNDDNVEDERIFKDLQYMSHGAINMFGSDLKLHEFKTLPGPSKKKKKK